MFKVIVISLFFLILLKMFVTSVINTHMKNTYENVIFMTLNILPEKLTETREANASISA